MAAGKLWPRVRNAREVTLANAQPARGAPRAALRRARGCSRAHGSIGRLGCVLCMHVSHPRWRTRVLERSLSRGHAQLCTRSVHDMPCADSNAARRHTLSVSGCVCMQSAAPKLPESTCCPLKTSAAASGRASWSRLKLSTKRQRLFTCATVHASKVCMRPSVADQGLLACQSQPGKQTLTLQTEVR
jgi:hypothetical protein